MKVGDKVVCVNPTAPLVKGREYVVESVSGCKCSEAVFVGIQADPGYYGTRCRKCDASINIDERRFFYSDRFRKLESHSAYINEVSLEKITEERSDLIPELI
jgi:hypothetical protein